MAAICAADSAVKLASATDKSSSWCAGFFVRGLMDTPFCLPRVKGKHNKQTKKKQEAITFIMPLHQVHFFSTLYDVGLCEISFDIPTFLRARAYTHKAMGGGGKAERGSPTTNLPHPKKKKKI